MALSPRALTCAFALSVVLVGGVKAEVSELTVAQQYGVSFLPLMMMEKYQLIEKQAAAAGLSGLKVSWAKVAGPSAMNDGLTPTLRGYRPTSCTSSERSWTAPRR